MKLKPYISIFEADKKTKYGFKSPSPGNISKKGKDVLAKVYANCRKNEIDNGGSKESTSDKTKCAKIANSVVTKQGYRK